MVSNDELHQNYRALSTIPFVQRAIKRVKQLGKINNDLVKENELLKKMMESLLDKQGSMNCCCGCRHMRKSCTGCCKTTTTNFVEVKQEQIEEVDLTNNDKNNNENIVYKIYEEEDITNNNKQSKTIVSDEVDLVDVEKVKIEEEQEVEVEESEEEQEVEVEESEEEVEVEVEVEVEEEEVEV